MFLQPLSPTYIGAPTFLLLAPTLSPPLSLAWLLSFLFWWCWRDAKDDRDGDVPCVLRRGDNGEELISEMQVCIW